MASDSGDETRARRRAPSGERKRDPERTKEKILQAALVEFGEHGYAGARIAAIAGRAGVNQQLISYYFDGKAGLMRALSERWRAMSSELNLAELPLAAVVTNFVRTGREQRAWTRLLVWQELTGGEQDEDPEHDAFFAGITAEAKRRQQAGELPADLDPGYVALILFAAAMAPASLPHVAKSLTGRDPAAPEFVDDYAEQITRLLAHLAEAGR